jgi:hypothetical protein
MASALIGAAFGFRVRYSRNRGEIEISDVVASRDLKKLCEVDLLNPVGEKHGRHYAATDRLRAIRENIRERHKAADPYELVSQSEQRSLPGLD